MSISNGSELLARLDQSRMTNRHKSMYATLVAGHLFDGYDINMMGFILPAIIGVFGLTKPQAGVLASCVFMGMLGGSILIGPIADRIGRKRSLLLAIALYSVFSFAAGLTHSYGSLVAMRILQGVGLGAEVPMVFTYLSEYMPAKPRGILLASGVFFWQAATFLAALVALVLVPAFGWRAMFFSGAVPAVILFIIWTRIPESVRYLIARGRVHEARTVVDGFSTVQSVEGRAGAVASSEHQGAGSVLDILRGGYLKATLGVWIMQFCGGFVFFGLAVWLPSIFLRMGFGIVHSFEYTAIITGSGALGNVFGGWLLDRVGRRLTLMLFFVLGGIFLLLWGTAHGVETLLLFGALSAFFSFGGAGGPLFAYTSEIYPTLLRGTGTGSAAAWQRIAGLVAPSVLGLMMGANATTYRLFALNAGLMFVGFLAALLLIHETRNKSLEQINTELARQR